MQDGGRAAARGTTARFSTGLFTHSVARANAVVRLCIAAAVAVQDLAAALGDSGTDECFRLSGMPLVRAFFLLRGGFHESATK